MNTHWLDIGIAVVFGLSTGVHLEARRWRGKGDHEYMNRCESAGKLYLVTRDSTKKYFWHIGQHITPGHYVSSGGTVEARSRDEADLMIRRAFAAKNNVPLAQVQSIQVSIEEYGTTPPVGSIREAGHSDEFQK